MLCEGASAVGLLIVSCPTFMPTCSPAASLIVRGSWADAAPASCRWKDADTPGMTNDGMGTAPPAANIAATSTGPPEGDPSPPGPTWPPLDGPPYSSEDRLMGTGVLLLPGLRTVMPLVPRVWFV